MGFTTPCFIRKNTKELRDKLKELGYEVENSIDNNFPCLLTHYRNPGKYWCVIPYKVNFNLPNGTIDCGDNEELFFAIAALRNDSDKYQWFWYNNKLFKCFGGGCTIQFNGDCSLRLEIPNEKTSYYDILKSSLKKATVEELIEHFKK